MGDRRCCVSERREREREEREGEEGERVEEEEMRWLVFSLFVPCGFPAHHLCYTHATTGHSKDNCCPLEEPPAAALT